MKMMIQERDATVVIGTLQCMREASLCDGIFSDFGLGVRPVNSSYSQSQ